MNNNIGKIVFNSWAGAFFQKGGGEVQLLKSKEALERLGLEVALYDQWSPQEAQILHQFSIESGVEHVVRKYKEFGKKVALSTIMWNLPPRGTYFYDRIKYIFDNSDILLTNSDIESQRISEYFSISIEKFHKTRNSIGDVYLSKGDKNIFRDYYSVKNDFILSVANVDRRKNTHLLVQACKSLDVQLVTIGHIKDTEYFNSFCNEYDKYFHLGAIEDEHILKSAYLNCSLFALPSLCETPGISALEAASQGSKILITQEGSTYEYFGDNAFYVDPQSLDSIIEGISVGLRSHYSESLRENIVNTYTWEKTAIEILEAYRKIIA